MAEQPGELSALLTWQLIDVLQPQVAAGLPIRSISSSAVKLGLDEAEAAELMLALTQRRSDATGSRVASLVRDADAAQQARRDRGGGQAADRGPGDDQRRG